MNPTQFNQAPPPPPGYGGLSPIQPGGIDPGVLQELRRTKGWVQFLGVLFQIGGAFMLLGGLLLMGGGKGLAQQMGNQGGAFGALFAAGGIIVLIMAAVFLYCGIRLFSYGSAIGALMFQNSSAQLETAINRHKSFWLVWTIFSVILTLLGLLAQFGMMANKDKIESGIEQFGKEVEMSQPR